MDYMEFYNTNEDFREYVEKHRKGLGISVEEALEHMIVKMYAYYVLHRND